MVCIYEWLFVLMCIIIIFFFNLLLYYYYFVWKSHLKGGSKCSIVITGLCLLCVCARARVCVCVCVYFHTCILSSHCIFNL